MTTVKKGYLARKTVGKVNRTKSAESPRQFRNWWLVKYANNPSQGYVPIKTITFVISFLLAHLLHQGRKRDNVDRNFNN